MLLIEAGSIRLKEPMDEAERPIDQADSSSSCCLALS